MTLRSTSTKILALLVMVFGLPGLTGGSPLEGLEGLLAAPARELSTLPEVRPAAPPSPIQQDPAALSEGFTAVRPDAPVGQAPVSCL